MAVYVVQTFLDGVGEGLHNLRIFGQVALLYAVGRVGHIAGVHAEGGDHIAVAIFLQGGGEGLKFHGVVGVIAGKRRGGQTEIDALVDGEIGFRVDAVFL